MYVCSYGHKSWLEFKGAGVQWRNGVFYLRSRVPEGRALTCRDVKKKKKQKKKKKKKKKKNAVPCRDVPCRAVPCRAMPRCAVPGRAMKTCPAMP